MLDAVAEKAGEAILSEGGFAGAICLITLGALGVVWRSGVAMTERFIEHLTRREQADGELRAEQVRATTATAEALRTMTNEIREHDHRMVSLILGVRPAGGGLAGEDLTGAD